MKRGESAMTLLEVMAAVAVVAIVFTTLARVASQGLQSEGTSRRRFQASLLADSLLADIEDGVAQGVTPELGSSESEEDIFTVTVDVTPFDLIAAIPMPAEAAAAATGLAAAPASALTGAIAGAGGETPVRQIEITVAWQEGFSDRSVYRTTFGLDQTAIQSVLGSAVQALGAGDAGAAPAGTIPADPGGTGR